ncbi:MAG TPA: phytanoyl-CoA dioxygenase family protein [Candidatus Binataceae bacterium]|nr:phytanoyl-CoA dioxygenase family protein [Candidatus Binataceae bacterium]
MEIRHLPNTVTGEEVAEAMNREGAVIIDNLLTVAQVDEVMAELRPWIDKTKPGTDSFNGFNTRRTGALIARSPICRRLVMHPLSIAMADKFLAHATNYRLHLTQVISVGPGEPAQSIHRDQWAFDLFSFPKGYEVQCNTIWAMTDFTAENGATRIIPGSNRFDDRLRFTESDTVPAEMRKGSVLMYSGSVYHGAGANRSDHVRIGLQFIYNLGWLRQEENQYLACPAEIARMLPVELLRLMGYARGAFSLGYVGDLMDPLQVVRPDIENDAPGQLENTDQLLKVRVDRERENALKRNLPPIDLTGAESGDK